MGDGLTRAIDGEVIVKTKLAAAAAATAAFFSVGAVALTASPAAAACSNGSLKFDYGGSPLMTVAVSGDTCGRHYRAVAHCDSAALGTHYYYGSSVTSGTSNASCSSSSLSWNDPLSVGYEYSVSGTWQSYIVVYDGFCC